ncbi:MAG: sulfatase-like hydrolase/transferase, partial [Bacteroidales bacterium]|nr:sulfatase-like hydrolase/transferase [Bacteroidales bacterium]
DLGYGDLGCYGHPIIKTPHIDKFASEGVRLTDCHAGGTVCSPSRAALLTGRNPYRSGFYYIAHGDTYLRNEEVTLAELLKTEGYETCFVGKWHLSSLEKQEKGYSNPGTQGFDHWFATSVNAFDGPASPGRFIRNGKPVGEIDHWYCRAIVEEAMEWMENKREQDKPFFLMVASHEPHTPIDPPDGYTKMYETPRVDSLEKTIKYGGVKRPGDISEHKSEYYGTITQLDKAFGDLINFVDGQGMKSSTLVLFTSDNGPEYPVTEEITGGEWDDPLRDKCFGTPGDYHGLKRYPYEGGHRVPGIVRYPGHIPAGSQSDQLINGTDFLPTFCHLAGVKVPSDRTIDGVDIWQGLLDNKVAREKPVMWLYPIHGIYHEYMPQLAMREDGYTLIGRFSFSEKPESLSTLKWIKRSVPSIFELYNMSEDPYQTRDVSEENPGLMNKLIPEMKKRWLNIRDEELD